MCACQFWIFNLGYFRVISVYIASKFGQSWNYKHFENKILSNFEIASVCFAVEFCISTNFEKFSHCVRHTRLTQLSDSELYKRFDITDIDHTVFVMCANCNLNYRNFCNTTYPKMEFYLLRGLHLLLCPTLWSLVNKKSICQISHIFNFQIKYNLKHNKNHFLQILILDII